MNRLEKQQLKLYFWAATAVLMAVNLAMAGPPFLTDDPEPVEYGHHELYFFATIDKTSNVTTVQAPAVEYNYGAAPNLQAHIIFPFTYFSLKDGTTAYGAGDTELGLKYRFIQEREDFPQVGTFPLIEVPTGDAERGLGNGRVWVKLPIWAQKSWGPWTTYGGGGWAVNGAAGQRNYPFGGWLLQRDFSERLTLGGEIFAQGKTTDTGEATVLANFGGAYNLSKNFSLLFTVGHNIASERHLISYFAFYFTW